MKSTAVFLLFLACGSLFAQKKFTLKNGCNFAARPAEQEYFIDKASQDIQKYVDEILGATSTPSAKNFEVRACSFGNATATIVEEMVDGRMEKVRYILVNQDFIKDFEKDAATKYAAYLVLAHEVAHHLLNHDFAEKNPDILKGWELAADQFAGSVLCTLCSTLKEAKAGMEKLPIKTATASHPAVSARLIFISKGWNDQKTYWDARGGRPCERAVPLVPTFGQNVCGNLARNVHAEVFGDRMEIIYDVPPLRRIPRIEVYLNFSPGCGLTVKPKALEWLDDRTIPGLKKKVVWYFTRDGYDRNDVLRPNDLGLVAFGAGNVPKPVKPIAFVGLGLVELAGIGTVAFGFIKEKESKPIYKTYTENLNPEADIYTNPGAKSRDAVYSAANKKHKTAQWLILGGSLATATGGFFLVKKIRALNCSRDMNLQIAGIEPPKKIEFEPVVFSENGPGIGLRVRF